MRSTGFYRLLISFFLVFSFLESQRIVLPFEEHEWLSPLSPTGITSIKDTIYACTNEGWILKTSSFNEMTLKKWKKLNFPGIDIAAFKNQIYILSRNGLYNSEGEKILNLTGGKKLIEKKNGLYILTEKSLIKFDGKLKTVLPLKSKPLETRTFNDYIVILTKNSIIIVKTPVLTTREISLPGYKEL